VRIGTNLEDVTVSKAALSSLLQLLHADKAPAAAAMVRDILQQHSQQEAEHDAWLAGVIAADKSQPTPPPKRNRQPERSWLDGVLAALAELARAIVGRGRK
jgi:hypothetical protein